jgi:hypothetical protein
MARAHLEPTHGCLNLLAAWRWSLSSVTRSRVIPSAMHEPN